MGEPGVLLFGKSEIRVILFLTALLLVGGAIAIYQKSSAVIGPEVIIQRIEAAPQERADAGGPEKDFLLSMLSRNRININTAPADSLEILPGIGPALAIRIVEHRESHGGFEAIGDIVNVRGIGPAKFAEIREMISTE